MSNEMVTRVREAIADNLQYGLEDAARAAIEAMRDCTPEMIEAGYDATRLGDGTPQFADAGFCLGHAAQIYHAMITAALMEGADG